jgi:hypothetical protein
VCGDQREREVEAGVWVEYVVVVGEVVHRLCPVLW